MPTQLKSHGIRVEVDASDDRMAKKIVNHTNQKVPFMLLAGDRDVEAGAVSFRFGDRTQINGVPRDEAVEAIVELDRRPRKRRAHSGTDQGGHRRRDAVATTSAGRRPRASASPTTCSGCGRRTG